MKTKSRLLTANYTQRIMPEKLQLSKFIGCVEHKFYTTIIFNARIALFSQEIFTNNLF
jgi:hypothetical protein